MRNGGQVANYHSCTSPPQMTAICRTFEDIPAPPSGIIPHIFPPMTLPVTRHSSREICRSVRMLEKTLWREPQHFPQLKHYFNDPKHWRKDSRLPWHDKSNRSAYKVSKTLPWQIGRFFPRFSICLAGEKSVDKFILY